MTKHPSKNIAIHTWDWRGFPDWQAIEDTINEYVKFGEISLKYVETGSDEHCIVLSADFISNSQAEMLYKNYHEWEDGKDGMELNWGLAMSKLQDKRTIACQLGMQGLDRLDQLNKLLGEISDGIRTEELYYKIIS